MATWFKSYMHASTSLYYILHNALTYMSCTRHASVTCMCWLVCKLMHAFKQSSSSCQPWKCKCFHMGATYYIKACWENQDRTPRIFCKFCVTDGIGARIPTHGALNNKEPSIYGYKDVKIHHWELNLSSSSAAIYVGEDKPFVNGSMEAYLIIGKRIRPTYSNVGSTPWSSLVMSLYSLFTNSEHCS